MVAGRLGRAVVTLGCVAAGLMTAPDVRADDPPRQRRERWEAGVLADTLFISRFHNFKEPGAPQYRFAWPAVLLGGRVSYFPEKYWGGELEAAFGSGSVGKRVSLAELRGPDEINVPWFAPVRGHVILQLPVKRVVPFALLGAGAIYVESTQMGRDVDFILDFGLGVRYLATKRVVPRLDLRLDMTQREDGGFSDGVALHSEIILGVGFVL
jgi:hypothetical protein